MKQIVVWGPPCSGKSTYVQGQMGPDDLRYDLGLLDMAISSRTDHTRQKSPGLKLLLGFRPIFIKATRDLASDGKAYIIASYLTKSLMDCLDEHTEFVRMDASEEECLSRLKADSTRPDKEAWETLIREWFAVHEDKEKSFVQVCVNKAATVAGASISEADMKLINAQALGELTPEQVYAFKVRACDDYVDRDHERFPPETLVQLAPMFVGKTMIFDHFWSAAKQTARVYETEVLEESGHYALMAKCYMLRTDSTRDIIAAIEGGILREVSVGCALAKSVCSICGEDYGTCGHRKGVAYDGIVCHVDLLDPIDAYEMSFVAVPAQPRAGVTKSAADWGITLSEMTEAKARLEIEHEKWRFV